MKYSSEDLIQEFFEKERSKYPGLTKGQMKSICFAPWIFLKEEIKSGELNEVRFKYFGVFRVYPGRAKAQLAKLDRLLSEGSMTKKRYEKLKIILTKYLSSEV